MSEKRILRQGVPQGGVLFLTLFLVFIRYILHRMPKDIQGAIYADDLALWCSEEYITTANYRQQQALQVIEIWTQSWLVKINEKKTTFTIFSLSNTLQRVRLKLNGQTTLGRYTYIPRRHHGLKDAWKHQLKRNHVRAKIRQALMKKLHAQSGALIRTC